MQLKLLEPPSPRPRPGVHYSDRTAIPKAVGLWESPSLEEEPSFLAVGTEGYIPGRTSPAPVVYPGCRHH